MSPRSSEYIGPWWADNEAVAVVYAMTLLISTCVGLVLGLVARTL